MRALIVFVAPSFVAFSTATLALAQNLPFNQPGTTKVYFPSKSAAALPGGTTAAPIANSPTTLESVFHSNQLSVFAPGTSFTSLSFRSASISWPASPASFSNYTIALARSLAAPGSLSPFIADNTAPDSLIVRAGPLVIPANALAPRPTPLTAAPFSFEIPFASPFLYNGGHLHLLLSHAGGGLPPQLLDAAPTSDPDNGILFQSRAAPVENATETTQSAPTPVVRLGVDPQISLPLVSATTSTGTSPFTAAFGTSAVTFQFVIAQDQLRFIPAGSIITSLSLRLAPGQVAWPASNTTSSSFQIQLSASPNAPTSMSEHFPSNIASDAILVRNGPLTLTPGFFPATDSRAVFSTPIHFTRGYVYTGGDLCVVVRHEAFSLPSPALDTANQPGAARTIFVQDTSSADGEFVAPDASLSLRLGYTPSLCVPRAFETITANGGAYLFDAPRVHQVLIDAPQLDHIPIGSTLNGISFRVWPVGLPGSVSWPSVDSSTPQLDIEISSTIRLAIDMSDFFANNEGDEKIRVRSGPLFIPAESFKVVDTSVAEHSFFIHFTTPYIYSGGNLCITMRVGQFTGTPINFDGRFRPAGHNGRRSIGSSASTSGHTALSFAARLAFTPPPNTCPADLNADGQVDDADFVLFLPAYDVLESPAADFNADALTDDADFSLFVVAYDAFLCP